MQVYIFGDPSIVSIEILIDPLEFCSARSFAVIPAVVGTHSNHIGLSIKKKKGGDIKPKCCDAVFMQTYSLTIDKYIGRLAHAFEFDKYFFSFRLWRQYKLL